MAYAKVFLCETSETVLVGKHLSDMFPIKNGLKEGDGLSPLHFKFVFYIQLGGLRKNRWACNRTVHIMFWFSVMVSTYWVEEYVL